MPEISAVPRSVELQRQLTSDRIREWLAQDVFSVRWWALILILAVCAAVWWKLLDKRRLPEMLLFTALAYIVVLAINEYGQELILWDYPMDVIPVFPPLSSVNLLPLPLVLSLLHQRFASFRSYFAVILLAMTAFCFIAEPLLVWAGLFELLNWRYWLSLPLYVTAAVLVRLAAAGMLRAGGKRRAERG